MLQDAFKIIPEQLGHQRNALRIEIIPPQERCALRPMTDAAVMTRARFNWRTDQLARIWSNFDYCNHHAGGCATCPFYRQHQERTTAPAGVVVAQDPAHKESWWLVPGGKNRWSKFGYWYRATERTSALAHIVRRWAIDIDPNRQSDEAGLYYNTNMQPSTINDK